MSVKIAEEELPPGEIPDEPWVPEDSLVLNDTDVNILQLDWRNPSYIPDVDVIIAADVVYCRNLIPPLCQLIK